MKNLAFFLMGYKGFAILNSFIATFGTTSIDFVVASKDPNVQNDYYEEILKLCKDNGVMFYDRKDNCNVSSDYAFAISWRWLINLQETTLIVFHDSLLPRYRGFAPLATAMINGDNEVGVTALYASEEYDKGNIIAQSAITLNYPVKINDAIKLVSKCYFDLVKSITTKILAGESVQGTLQDEDAASYSLWLDDKDYRINWTRNSTYIKRFIDSIGYPFNGATTLMDGKLVRILDAEVVDDVNIPVRHQGKIIFIRNGKPIVVCGEGLLQINELVDEEYNSMLPLKKFRIRFE